MRKIRLFINGFGRIGRSAFRIAIKDERFEIVGINDIYDYEQMRYLLEYDSIYHKFDKSVRLEDDLLIIDTHKIKLHNQKDPKNLPLKKIDLVLECSGIFLTKKSATPFIEAGAKKVLISTPTSSDIPTFIIDINHSSYNGEKIVSNSSCSANAIVPIMSIIDKELGVEGGSFGMYHSYTAYQKLLDVKHYSSDIRRARSATQNIQPLVSSAQKECEKFFPYLKDRLSAKSIRVPIAATTLYDFTLKIKKRTNKDELNDLLKDSTKEFRSLDLAHQYAVSSDFIGSKYAALIDIDLTQVIGDELIKVFAWQDNEYGYAYQLIEMAKEIG